MGLPTFPNTASISPQSRKNQANSPVLGYHLAMPGWDDYPDTYRQTTVQAILPALGAGECVSVVGLSGAGKSNLLGFLANRQSTPALRLTLIDSNRLPEFSREAFLRLITKTLNPAHTSGDLEAVFDALAAQLQTSPLALLLDLSLLDRSGALAGQNTLALFNNLRALRDAHKYQLTFVTASRHSLPTTTEFAELVQAHTLWLGCLDEAGSRWNIARYQSRIGQTWDEATTQGLIDLSRGYPSLLRAACEAFAATHDLAAIPSHPAVLARVQEFWADAPTDTEIKASGLANHPLLTQGQTPTFDTSQLTAKEHLLLNYFLAHLRAICEKDDIIKAVWPEDKVFERGVRDDSLAQLIRRLREKIEPEPGKPRYLHTVPGRGYKFTT
jgi:hypothetical protein